MENTTTTITPRRLGEYLICSDGVLQNAVKKQGQALKTGQPFKRIGQILLENGDITEDELNSAINRQRSDRLAACPVFHTLNKTELTALSSRFEEVSVSSGKQFIIQDQPDPTLFIICSGKVEVYRTTLEGEHIHIAYVEPPEPIGEMGYFSGGIRTASVKAVESVELLCAEYTALTHYFENVPKVAFAFTSLVEERRKAMEAITANQG